MEHNNGYARTLGWFLVGSAAGVCTALLLAPATGKRTRERLARRLRDTRESVTDFTDDIVDTARQVAAPAGRATFSAFTSPATTTSELSGRKCTPATVFSNSAVHTVLPVR